MITTIPSSNMDTTTDDAVEIFVADFGFFIQLKKLMFPFPDDTVQYLTMDKNPSDYEMTVDGVWIYYQMNKVKVQL